MYFRRVGGYRMWLGSKDDIRLRDCVYFEPLGLLATFSFHPRCNQCDYIGPLDDREIENTVYHISEGFASEWVETLRKHIKQDSEFNWN